MCAGVAVQYTRQEPWYHIMAQILHCSLISDRVWCYSLFEHFTGPAIFRYEGHSSTAGRILKLSCQRWILLCSCPRIRIQRLSRCRGCYGYVTALVYVQLWDNTGRDCPVIYPLITFFFFFFLQTSHQICLYRPKAPRRFHPKLTFSCAASGRQGLGQCSSEKPACPPPSLRPPLQLGGNPFVALAPLLRLWSRHLENRLH